MKGSAFANKVLLNFVYIFGSQQPVPVFLFHKKILVAFHKQPVTFSLVREVRVTDIRRFLPRILAKKFSLLS